MAVQDWIDEIVDRWTTIDAGTRKVRSYLVFRRNEYPENLDPGSFPAALTLLEGMTPEYAAAGSWGYWSGLTDFHLTTTADKAKLRDVYPYFEKIYAAAAVSLTLGVSTVAYFSIIGRDGGVGIEGPLEMQYGDETPHWGVRVRWTVKENISGEVTVAA